MSAVRYEGECQRFVRRRANDGVLVDRAKGNGSVGGAIGATCGG